MTKTAITILFAAVLLPAAALAEDFLGVPLTRDAEETMRTDARLEYTTSLSHEDIVEFYKKELEELPDIKFREWDDSTYIEDDGREKWHSVTVAKEQKDGQITVVVMKDNWTWIIGTLVLRFFGVFAVLLTLLIGMTVSGAIISRSIKRMEARGGARGGPEGDAEIAAAIAAAKQAQDKQD